MCVRTLRCMLACQAALFCLGYRFPPLTSMLSTSRWGTLRAATSLLPWLACFALWCACFSPPATSAALPPQPPPPLSPLWPPSPPPTFPQPPCGLVSPSGRPSVGPPLRHARLGALAPLSAPSACVRGTLAWAGARLGFAGGLSPWLATLACVCMYV